MMKLRKLSNMTNVANVMNVAVLLSLAVLGTVVSLAQHNAADDRLEVQHVAGAVYMLVGPGGNIGATVGEDGILIVDDKFDRTVQMVKNTLKDFNKGALRFILNTHWHGDHTGGNAELGKEATIIAHTNIRKRLSAEQTTRFGTTPPMAESGWPVITFDKSLSIHFNGEEISVLHLPKGHTDGDSVILFKKSNVLHMGDDFFNGMFPYVDLDAGGSVEGMIEAIEHVLKEAPADVRIIPGHGPLATIDDLKKHVEMMKATSAHVRAKMKAGKSLDEIKAEGLPDEWDKWSWGFINTEFWIETIYNSYSM